MIGRINLVHVDGAQTLQNCLGFSRGLQAVVIDSLIPAGENEKEEQRRKEEPR